MKQKQNKNKFPWASSELTWVDKSIFSNLFSFESVKNEKRKSFRNFSICFSIAREPSQKQFQNVKSLKCLRQSKNTNNNKNRKRRLNKNVFFKGKLFPADKETRTTMFGEITIEIVWDLKRKKKSEWAKRMKIETLRNTKTIKDFFSQINSINI